MEIPEGPVSGDWYATGNPYNINGEIYIDVDSTLNIYEGVEVIFQGHYKLIVNGFLQAIGTEADSILFTASNPTTGWHGIRFISAQDSSHLSYCIVQNGYASGAGSDAYGGGIYCENSNPVFTHSSIRQNTAMSYDGGICIITNSNPILYHCEINANNANAEGGIGCLYGSSPIMSHCTIAGNYATRNGGGLYMDTNCSPIISDCVISNNTAGAGYYGGGLQMHNSCDPIITNCDIRNNSAALHGGGVRISQGCDPVMTDCNIFDNTAGGCGGGISCDDCPNPILNNCKIWNNFSSMYGGGIHLTNSAIMQFSCCTIYGNTSVLESGGMEINNGSNATVSKCTITGNESMTASGSAISIVAAEPEFDNSIIAWNFGNSGVYFSNSYNARFQYCDFYENEGGDFDGDVPTGLGVITGVNVNADPCDDFNNIFEDPQFIYPDEDDYQLSWGSACIDAGMGTDPDATIADMGMCYFDQSMQVRAIMSPFDMPIEIPATGGSFDFAVHLTNIAPVTLAIDAWINVTLPSGGTYGPVLGPLNLNLGSEFTLTRIRDQVVPANAPAGMYTYNIYAVYESDTTSDSFSFTKLGAGGMDGMGGWINTGEPFDDLIADAGVAVPVRYALHQNYPNPFNPTTTISYMLQDASYTTLAVYDVQGREVARLVNGWRDAGLHEVTFDATNLSSGVYLYRLKAGDFNGTGKMVLMK